MGKEFWIIMIVLTCVQVIVLIKTWRDNNNKTVSRTTSEVEIDKQIGKDEIIFLAVTLFKFVIDSSANLLEHHLLIWIVELFVCCFSIAYFSNKYFMMFKR